MKTTSMKSQMKIGVIMDDLDDIHSYKDSTVAVILEAQKRGHFVYYMQLKDIFCENTTVCSTMYPIHVDESITPWYQLQNAEICSLNSLNVVLMRKDPPFNMAYLY